MKVIKQESNKSVFKPYSKTIQINVENLKDEVLLAKLNQHACGNKLELSYDGDVLRGEGYTVDEETRAEKLVNSLFQAL